MIQYNMLDAKNNLSKICQMLKDKEEDYVLIANNGKPVAKIIPFESTRKAPGFFKNKYKCLDNIDWFDNSEIEELFYGDDN